MSLIFHFKRIDILNLRDLMTHFQSGSVAKLESRTFRRSSKTENAKERKRRFFLTKSRLF
jgi:hypothetical protein